MNVALIGTRDESIARAQEILSIYDGKFHIWNHDLSKVSEIDSLVSSIYNHFGSIDVLVNCAGIVESKDIELVGENDWNETLDLNLKATYFVIQNSLPYLKKGVSPRIINISSNAGRMGGFANGGVYAASKGGLIALTYNLARKLAPFKITVNCVAPGTIESEVSKILIAASPNLISERIPLGRLGTSSEVATAVCYFASLESSFTTGAVIDVNGGMFMG